MKFGIDKLGIGIDTLRDPTRVLDAWKTLAEKPFGRQLFSRAIGLMAPYSGTIGPQVLELAPGYARVQMRDRWGVRNHLKSVHAVALMNLGEVATGLAVMSLVPQGGRGIVTELGMEYVKKARGTITCEARIDLPKEAGTHDVTVEGELRNSIGEVVSRVRARWRIDVPATTGPRVDAEDAMSADTGAEVDASVAAAAHHDVADEGDARERVTGQPGAPGDVTDEGATPPPADLPTTRQEIADEGPAGQRMDIVDLPEDGTTGNDEDDDDEARPGAARDAVAPVGFAQTDDDEPPPSMNDAF